ELAAHSDRVDGANLSAEAAEEAAARAQDELAEFAVAFLRRKHVHLQAAGRTDARAESTGDTECLAGLRIGAQRWQPAEARRHNALLIRVLHGLVRHRDPAQRD